MNISKNVPSRNLHMDDSGVFRVNKCPVCLLRPHEDFIQTHLDEVEGGVINDGIWTRPIIVCFFTGIILDGHHRHQVALRNGLKFVPVVYVNYSSEDIVIYNGDKKDTLTSETIINTVERGLLLPRKFTRHVFSGSLAGIKEATCRVPMYELN